MKIPVAWKRAAFVAALFGVVVAWSQPVAAQNPDKDLVRLDRRISNLIRSIGEIKWQNITIYKLEDEYKSRLIKGMEADDKSDIDYVEAGGQTIYTDPLPNIFDNILQCAQSARTNRGRNPAAMKLCVAQKYNIDPDDLDETEFNNMVSRVMNVKARRDARPKDFFLVTSRDKSPVRLIAVFGIKESETGEPMMVGSPWAGTDLYRFLSTNDSTGAMYSEIKQAVAENSPLVSNQMVMLRDLTDIILQQRTKARASELLPDKYSYVLTSISTGRPIRGNYTPPAPVSDSAGAEGVPAEGGLFGGGFSLSDMFGPKKNLNNRVEGAEVPKTTETPYEIGVGTDIMASFISYTLNDQKKAPEPDWGIELRNNLDELNYPSVWGGRLTASAILENVKIGAVLPQLFFRKSTIAESGLGSHPIKLIDAYGIAMSGDFTAPILDNSGLFNFYASYSFSAPERDVMRLQRLHRTIDGRDTSFSVSTVGEVGYFVRFVTQAFYSFGFFLDENANHLFRLKIGGTVYGVDQYVREQDKKSFVSSDSATSNTMRKFFSETFGGVSGKIEYMKSGNKIPYGAGIQYIDQSVLGDVWLQFIVSPRLDLKFGLKYFTPVFRDAHVWENENLVVPTASLKYHFGL